MRLNLAAFPYPRSFFALLAGGFLLVALPLAGALLYSVWNAERLATQASNAVVDATQAARGSRSMVNRISAIERIAQQAAVYADDELRADYARIRSSFGYVTGELAKLPLEAEQLGALRRTVEQEAKLHALLGDLRGDLRGGRTAAAVSRQAAELAQTASEVLAISYVAADREVERLRVAAESVRRRMIGLLLVTLAAALAVALALARLITRPIRELDASIRQLGSADFGRPIRVRGPQDLQFLGERLDWLRRRLTELEEQKNRFLRHVSHELKTPLTAVREGAELLRDEVGGTLSPQQRQIVAIVRDNTVRLQRMIEDLLDYQRALHDAMSLERRPVALDALLREVAEAHGLQARAKRQTVAVDARTAPALPMDAVSVIADPVKLRTVFDNLLDNAIKFTPQGGRISLAVSGERDSVSVDVMDNGPGVPKDERRSIFDTFFRGRAPTGGRVEGSGLGLAIAREFVQAHGGTIGVLPRNDGAHFRVVLPRTRAASFGEQVGKQVGGQVGAQVSTQAGAGFGALSRGMARR